MECEGYWLALLICVVSALKKEEKCNEKHLGPWEEPMEKPDIPPALMASKLNGKPVANTVKTKFNEIMKTVSTVIPKHFKARSVKLDKITASGGQIIGLKKACSNPKSLSVTSDDSGTLHVRFTVDLKVYK
uniref:Invertase n=1 Tax=Lygus hesperus TaxID=30085 RepID=A0A0A9XDP4_LYGHE